uniref:Copine n=1 Tax=Globodera rostochiensis TaxID=31243 RepID=A0A914HIT1_GLORO
MKEREKGRNWQFGIPSHWEKQSITPMAGPINCDARPVPSAAGHSIYLLLLKKALVTLFGRLHCLCCAHLFHRIPPPPQMKALPKDRGPCARVELVLSAKSLADRDLFSKSDPICLVEESVQRGTPPNLQNVFVEIGRTERIKNSLNPRWSKKILLSYYFESKQHLRFNIYDIDSESDELSKHDFLGRCECELADIVSAPDGALSLPLKDLPNQSGLLTICAEEVDDGQRESVHFVCHGIGLKQSQSLLNSFCMGKRKRTFLELYRLMDNGSRLMVHRTENARGAHNPEWKPFEVSVRHLCAGEKDRQFVVECYELREASGKHRLVGFLSTSVNALLNAPKGLRLELLKADKKGHSDHPKAVGTVHFLEVRLQREHSFLDFVSRGMQLEFAVSVDLTASNGEVTRPSSLHHIDAQRLNQYECAISAVLEICEHYNRTKQFEAYGFGAKIPPAYAVSHMFPLRLNNFERIVHGVSGVLDAYRCAVVNTQLFGPTNFAPTIREFVYKTSKFPRDGSRYQVLLILTDGVITDMHSTIRTIVDASHQPMSIIIIGIGNDEFTKMDALDADNCLLFADGHTAARDIVQFVPFRDFFGAGWTQNASDQEYLKSVLAKEVLAELPDQVCSFMKSHNISPPLRTPQPVHQQFAPPYPILPATAIADDTPHKQMHASPPPPYPPNG